MNHPANHLLLLSRVQPYPGRIINGKNVVNSRHHFIFVVSGMEEVTDLVRGRRFLYALLGCILPTLSSMQMVIKEVLRLHPPNPMLVPRESREDCEIMGYHIPKGTKIHVNAFAISRDPRYWYNPEAFNPERFENSNVDFKGTNFEFTPSGAGRRQCPAILFGTSALEIALANLLYHFEWVLPDGENSRLLDMSETFGMGVRKKVELHLRATPYVHSGYI